MKMYTNTQLSSFVRYKRSNPAFCVALEDERKLLCDHLRADGSSPDLVEELEDYRRRPCGLAACPLCLGRADKQMFEYFHRLREGNGDTVRVWSPHKQGFKDPEIKEVPGLLKEIGDLIEFSEITVDAYVGRFFCLTNILNSNGLQDFTVDGFFTGFMGAMRMTDFPIECEDDKVKAADFTIGNVAEPITASTDFYDDHSYVWFDKKVMPWQMREARKRRYSKQTRETLIAHEVTLAKALGFKQCDYLALWRRATHQL